MPNYSEVNRSMFPPKIPLDNPDLSTLREINNPNGQPVGHFTGRCIHCGSKDLWDDNLAYGCNCCGALLASN